MSTMTQAEIQSAVNTLKSFPVLATPPGTYGYLPMVLAYSPSTAAFLYVESSDPVTSPARPLVPDWISSDQYMIGDMCYDILDGTPCGRAPFCPMHPLVALPEYSWRAPGVLPAGVGKAIQIFRNRHPDAVVAPQLHALLGITTTEEETTMNTRDIHEEAYQVGKEIIAASAKPDVENTPEQYKVQQRKAKRAFKLRPGSRAVRTQVEVFNEEVVQCLAESHYEQFRVYFSSHAEPIDLLSYAADNGVCVQVGVGVYKGEREISYACSVSGFVALLKAGFLLGQETIVLERLSNHIVRLALLIGLNSHYRVVLGEKSSIDVFNPADVPEGGTIMLHDPQRAPLIKTYE